ncbi:WD40-repeat-containing domain protein [Rhodocollybia butyracea]|uniref:WD40-repeat-containing domain protein n=1 Tax=Rhodocollybia butyracea TaxID=206335 RepID=A0A9P5PCB3_9AGAR|nr:WD40-repeat-containing domain protein [Rhodocollybia butyracea]
MPYKLSATLKAHTSDVRAVISPANDIILSASRDSTAISWQKASSSSSFIAETVIKASSRYVNAVAYVPPTPDAPKGYAVTGSQDSIINVFSLSSPKEDPDFSLLGHSDNVCTLDVTPGGTIISGSWDRTAKVWKNFNLAYELTGHEQSVWAVLAVDEELVLTGSADKTIKLWNQHKLVSTFKGHQDAVRGLALIPELGFASASNDSEIRVWTIGGDLIYSLSGHTSFVYSLSVLPSGGIVSGGEDRAVRVWKDGECAQVLVHPAISVWTVSSMPNGDIVSGCSDGIIRVFSESEERWASPQELQAYEDLVASQALPSQELGDIKKNDLPGPEALNAPGKKPGEQKMVKNGDIVELHQWDATNNSWQKIGDVVGAVGQGTKKLYQGKEYDYVFDVDIQDGVPPLKLPFNVTENPYAAAQRFLEVNDLPLSYIDQVVEFINKNTSGVSLGSNEDYVDPFTGGSRYRSSGNSVPTHPSGSSAYVDPYTGASRYSGNSAAPPSAPSSAYADPFTGASRYSGASQTTPAPPPPAPSKRIPMAAWNLYKPANVPLMSRKTFEIDGRLRDEISTSSLALYPQEISSFEDTFAYLTQATDPNSKNLNLPAPTASSVESIIQVLERWPSTALYPVVDLTRLVVAFCPGLLEDSALKSRLLQALLVSGEWSSSWAPPLVKSREINLTLVLKTLANMFQEGTSVDGTWVNETLFALSQLPYEILSKVQRTCLATVLFNMSCTQLRTPFDDYPRQQFLEEAFKILKNETADSETVYRALFAVGNTLHAMKSNSIPLEPAQNQTVLDTLSSLSPAIAGDARVRDLVGELATFL